MPGRLSGQDWSRSPGYNFHYGGAQCEQVSSYPYSSTPYNHDFEYQQSIRCPASPGISSEFDPACGLPPWPPASKSLWLCQHDLDPYWLYQYSDFSSRPGSFHAKPGYSMGPFDNGWKEYLSCNEKIHTEIANCKAEETESCKKQIALLEQRLHAHYTKEIEKKCNNQFSHPLYGSDYKEWFRKEKASLEERLQAQCATAQLNAATKCKSDQDTMREEHRKVQNQLEQENEILKKQNFENAQKAKNDQAAKEKLEREKEELMEENKKLKKQDDDRVQKAKDYQAAKEKLEREKEELAQENKKLKKQDDDRVQKAKDDQAAKEKLEREKEELTQENKKLKKQDDDRVQKAKDDQAAKEKLEREKEELAQENKKLKKQDDDRVQKAKDDQAAKEKLEREKEELTQENKKLKKQDDDRVQKAKDDQAAKEKLERENEKLKAESRPEPKPQKIGPQNNSTSEFEAFSKQKCPSLHGQRATAFGVTYEAFCGARPRGRYTDDYVESKNFGDCMGACTVDRSCQGVYYETHLSRCRMTMDWEYPPLGWADNTEFSFVPVSPREGGIGATTPDLPSRLIKDDYMDNASCPDSDGSIVSVGSLQFRVHCREYQPKKQLESVGSSRRASGMLAICALNPACQGVAYSASSVYMIAEHEKLPEKTRNSDLVKAHHWVIMLTEPRVAA